MAMPAFSSCCFTVWPVTLRSAAWRLISRPAPWQVEWNAAPVIVPASTYEECVAEAVVALVESFADVSARPAEGNTVVPILPEGDQDQDILLAALNEVIHLLDTQSAIPVTVQPERTSDARLQLSLGLVALDHVRLTGPAPKAVTMHRLRFGRDDTGWSCEVTIDV
jgi:SHS2 domain-containing protein